MESLSGKFIKAAAALTVAMSAITVLGEHPAKANPPDQGSIQWNRMVPYAEFISKMHTKYDGWCCNWADGRMGDGANDLKEEHFIGSDNKEHIKVFVTRNVFGEESHNPKNSTPIDTDYDYAIPPAGKWVIIPDNTILKVDDLATQCFDNDTHVPSKDCDAPGLNVLWLNRNDGTPYCYWPVQRWSKNDRHLFESVPPSPKSASIGDFRLNAGTINYNPPLPARYSLTSTQSSSGLHLPAPGL